MFVSACQAPDFMYYMLTVVCHDAQQLYMFKCAVYVEEQTCTRDENGGSEGCTFPQREEK